MVTGIETRWVWIPTPYPLVLEGYTTVELLLSSLILLAGFVGALLGVYLLYVDTIIVHHTALFKIMSVGMLIVIATAPVMLFLSVEFVHGIHGLAALVITAGLYTLILERITEPADSDP